MYHIEFRAEAWGYRYDIYLNGGLITVSETVSDALGYVRWHRRRKQG